MAKEPTRILSHWYTLIDNLEASSLDFYKSVEEAIARREVPKAETSRVDWREGGVFSAKREYLRVTRDEFIFDVCGAPFGKGFFVSWWLGDAESGFFALLSKIPVVGLLFRWFIKPITYYKIDTGLMFQSSVHTAVLEIVDQLTKAKGLRALSELERKPILREFFQR